MMRYYLGPSKMGVMASAKETELRVGWYPRGWEPPGAEEDSLHNLKGDKWKRTQSGAEERTLGKTRGRNALVEDFSRRKEDPIMN